MKRKNFGIYLNQNEWDSLSEIAMEQGFGDRNKLIRAIANREIPLSTPPETGSSKRPQDEMLLHVTAGDYGQQIARSLRMWVILRSLGQLSLPEWFLFADWRVGFFADDHPSNDSVPTQHNAACPCNKLTKDWLTESGVDLDEWVSSVSDRTKMSQIEVEGFVYDRLFAVTRRSLSTDFKALTKQGFLEGSGQRYRVPK